MRRKKIPGSGNVYIMRQKGCAKIIKSRYGAVGIISVFFAHVFTQDDFMRPIQENGI